MLTTKVLSKYFVSVEQFRTLLWANQFYFVFFIPMIWISIIFIVHPYTHTFRSLEHWQDRSHAYLLMSGLLLLIMVETSIYLSGILLIMGEQNEKWITNPEHFIMLEISVMIMAFVAIPTTSIFSHWQIRKLLKKKGIEQTEKIQTAKLCIVWMTFIILLILAEFFSFTTSRNYYLEFLNSFSHYLQPYTSLFQNDAYRLGIILAIIPSLSVIFFITRNRKNKKNKTNHF